MEEILAETNEEQPQEAPAQVDVDWQKRYNDLRPQYDRTVTDMRKAEQEATEQRLRNLELQQELQQRPTQAQEVEKTLTEDDFYTDKVRQAISDFPEIADATKAMIAFETQKLQRGRESERVELTNQIQALEARNESLERRIESSQANSALSSRLGSNVWPALADHEAFVTWVNQDRMRVWQMRNGELNHKVDCVNAFLATPEGQQFTGNYVPQQEVRRQDVQGIMGGQPPVAPQGQSNLTGQALWDAIPEYKVE